MSKPLTFAVPRLSLWWALALLLLALVWLMAPHQLPVTIYKLSLLSLAAVAGYWVDRALYPYARPHAWLRPLWAPLPPLPPQSGDPQHGVTSDGVSFVGGELSCLAPDEITPDDVIACVAMLRRALIVAAAMLAIGLGA